MDLLRQEVLDSNTQNAFGSIVLTYPNSNRLMLGFAATLLILIALFVFLVGYTRHATVQGVLEPSKGIVKIYAPQNGVLTKAFVHEGQFVRKGEILLEFKFEHGVESGGTLERVLDNKLRDQLEDLRHELRDSLLLETSQASSLRKNLENQRKSLDVLRAQAHIQLLRKQSTEQILQRYQTLLDSGYVSPIQVQQKHDDLLDQQIRLEGIQQSINAAEADVSRLTHELSDIPLKKRVTNAQIGRTISSDEAELTKQSNAHLWTVTAPCDGVVTSLTVSLNQTINNGSPVLMVSPADSELIATLYVPSRSLGFIQPGQLVKIKIDAFPYQKFGMLDGRITSVADSPMRQTEVSAGTRLFIDSENNEPQFAIRVSLSHQYIDAYGRQQYFRAGMQINADIQLETRQLYEWVLEPLYSLHGN